VELYLSWQRAPADRVARGREASTAFFADYGGLASLPLTRGDLRAIDAPLTVLESDFARPHQRAAAAVLERLAPNATRGEGDIVSGLRAAIAR
jgi:hypothetical protein